MLTYLTSFIVTFVSVGLRTMQTRNVMQERYLILFVNSWCIEALYFAIILKILTADVYHFIALGMGASLGSVTFVKLHKRFFK